MTDRPLFGGVFGKECPFGRQCFELFDGQFHRRNMIAGAGQQFAAQIVQVGTHAERADDLVEKIAAEGGGEDQNLRNFAVDVKRRGGDQGREVVQGVGITKARLAQLPEAFTSVTGLGVPVDYFPQSKTNRLVLPIMAVAMIIASAITCAWGLDTGFGGYLRYGLASVYTLVSVPVLVTGVLFIVGMVTAVYVLINRSRCVVAYEKGLVVQDRHGLKPVRWEEIGEFYLSITRHFSYGIPAGTSYRYTVKKTGGERLVFDNGLENIQHLGGLIGRNILPIQYKLAADVYNSGQTASFGPVAVNRAGLTVSKKTYPWNEIEQVSVHDGVFKVSKKGGGWFSGASTPVASIPNLEAMLSIIDQVVGVKVG